MAFGTGRLGHFDALVGVARDAIGLLDDRLPFGLLVVQGCQVASGTLHRTGVRGVRELDVQFSSAGRPQQGRLHFAFVAVQARAGIQEWELTACIDDMAAVALSVTLLEMGLVGHGLLALVTVHAGVVAMASRALGAVLSESPFLHLGVMALAPICVVRGWRRLAHVRGVARRAVPGLGQTVLDVASPAILDCDTKRVSGQRALDGPFVTADALTDLGVQGMREVDLGDLPSLVFQVKRGWTVFVAVKASLSIENRRSRS